MPLSLSLLEMRNEIGQEQALSNIDKFKKYPMKDYEEDRIAEVKEKAK